MGREVRRVAAGFDWPLDKIWGGFVNPFYQQSIDCPANCEGGHSPQYIALKNQWYGYAPFRPEDRGSVPLTPDHPAVRAFAERNTSRAPEYYGIGEDAVVREALRLCSLFNAQWSHHLNQEDVNALVAANRMHDFTHTWKKGEGWKKKDPPFVPTAEQVNAWSIGGLGHDSINCYVVIEAELKRLGHPVVCTVCDGDGRKWPSTAIHKAYEDWERTDPPAGDWWQVWETVSEGSPVTPAFATREELVDYLVGGGDAWDRKRSDGGWTRENAESFVSAAWAPSLISVSGKAHAPRDGAISESAGT